MNWYSSVVSIVVYISNHLDKLFLMWWSHCLLPFWEICEYDTTLYGVPKNMIVILAACWLNLPQYIIHPMMHPHRIIRIFLYSSIPPSSLLPFFPPPPSLLPSLPPSHPSPSLSQGSDAYERQYGGRALGKKTGKCFNCKQRGQHTSNTCPHPIVSSLSAPHTVALGSDFSMWFKYPVFPFLYHMC